MYVYRVTGLASDGTAAHQRDFGCRADADLYARTLSLRGYVAAVRLVYSPSATGTPARRVA